MRCAEALLQLSRHASVVFEEQEEMMALCRHNAKERPVYVNQVGQDGRALPLNGQKMKVLSRVVGGQISV